MSISEAAPPGPLHLAEQKNRTIVLCFDGTGEYEFAITNVVKLYSILQKDKEDQVCYYQPCLGTRFTPGKVRTHFQWAERVLDKYFATSLSDHVLSGYQYLMECYEDGDRICIFGFSRGAYTAQGLAGMLHKVGLLRRENEVQLSSAYTFYKATDSRSDIHAPQFKRTFCRDVTIDFVGLWDTVCSVGILKARTLPSIEVNTTTRECRQALALDEHRAKFRPVLCTSPNIPANRPIQPGADASEQLTSVQEVWFSGCHQDVGGGGKSDTENQALSDISLQWMIEQIVGAECGIQLDLDAFDQWQIPREIGQRRDSIPGGGETSEDASRRSFDPQKRHDAVMKMTDKLNVKKTPWWWIFEIFPTSYNHRNAKGKRVTSWWPHFGRGRSVPPGSLLHMSVQTLIEDPHVKYKPKARYTNDAVRFVS